MAVTVGLLAAFAAPQATANFLYVFEQTGTTNSFSFTVPNILTSATDPLTPAIGQSVGGFAITDAIFAPFSGTQFCISLGSNTNAFNCGLENIGLGFAG